MDILKHGVFQKSPTSTRITRPYILKHCVSKYLVKVIGTAKIMKKLGVRKELHFVRKYYVEMHFLGQLHEGTPEAPNWQDFGRVYKFSHGVLGSLKVHVGVLKDLLSKLISKLQAFLNYCIGVLRVSKVFLKIASVS